MSGIGSGRSQSWNLYTSSDTETPWKSSVGTSMDAISFGFVATAILVSMFLVMAIFEHLFRPADATSGSLESGSIQKLGNPNKVSNSYGFSVLMPGQPYPTHIAQPAPLPCPREAISWPPHEHNSC